MISILTTTERIENLRQLIEAEFRLTELVSIATDSSIQPDIIVDDRIQVNPDWKNNQPPVLFPRLSYCDEVLLGLIFLKLGNMERAWPLLGKAENLLDIADWLNRLQIGLPVEEAISWEAVDPVSMHNKAIAVHYGVAQVPVTFEKVAQLYQDALNSGLDSEEAAFTAKHYAILLADAGNFDEAGRILQDQMAEDISPAATVEMKFALCQTWMQQLVVPYDDRRMQELKSMLSDCLQFYELHQLPESVAGVLYESAQVALLCSSFSESLGYINKCIALYEELGLTELAAQAQLRKAHVLKTWGQQDNPQFYRPAVQAYQEAVRVFNRTDAPDVFAEIQHQLGILYSEIPDEISRKGIWASVSVSSFKEALNYYNKVDYPYQFGMVCNDFGLAYHRFPQSLHTDNFERSLDWFREALDVFDEHQHPTERAGTLLNYINASWYAGNQSEFEETRYQDMLTKAKEITRITDNKEMLISAKLHLEKLLELKSLQQDLTL